MRTRAAAGDPGGEHAATGRGPAASARRQASFSRFSESTRALHARFYRMHLDLLPSVYITLDTSRLTALYFCVVGLDVLGMLDAAVPVTERAAMVEWIYGLQASDTDNGGFRGSGWAGTPLDPIAWPARDADAPHLAMTFTALATLATLGDNLTRVRRVALRAGVALVSDADGSCAADVVGRERDLRFLFCAAAAGRLLDFPLVDARLARAHVAACQAYDGGLGLAPGCEAHGGSTYCGAATRALLPPAEDVLDSAAAAAWCVRRHSLGSVHGRANKPPDTCYAFWVGAAARCFGVRDISGAESFVLSCEKLATGGFAKHPAGAPPDLLHTFYSLAALSWTDIALRPIDPALGVCEDRIRALDAHRFATSAYSCLHCPCTG
mmetsp:Transcript_22088/g.66297  ORF Transcript_22088/g.66297 Transcript_22088/m.66297 type:complete len:381 (-) Transcript_22088:4287-5429(-)